MLRGLYAITDSELTPLDTITNQVRDAIAGGAGILQFRYKGEITADVLIKLSELQKICKDNNVLFIINDHKRLAKEIDADGIHIGKDDENDLASLREEFKGKIIGVSCYGDIERAKKAQNLGADYVAFGSFFYSPTKPHSNIVSMQTISEAKKVLDIPVCVIGGISTQNAPSLVQSGADMISVISGLWEGNIRAKAEIFDSYFAKELS